eukprot:132113-Chlamydomonas_euryale.AAC.6
MASVAGSLQGTTARMTAKSESKSESRNDSKSNSKRNSKSNSKGDSSGHGAMSVPPAAEPRERWHGIVCICIKSFPAQNAATGHLAANRQRVGEQHTVRKGSMCWMRWASIFVSARARLPHSIPPS